MQTAPVRIVMTNSILMLYSESDRQMNSFIVTTEEGGLIVIDGGFGWDAEKLLDNLRKVSGEKVPHIDAWFLSHAHDDHIAAFTEIIRNHKNEVEFDRVYFNFPSYQFVYKYETTEAHTVAEFYEVLPEFADRICIVSQDDVYEIKGAVFEFLYTPDPSFTFNAVNNSSSVFKMTLGGKSVLFLGDAGVEAGRKLLREKKDKLKSDIVQMAHHGQSGVEKSVYEEIKPSECIWCAPKWLWDNDAGEGFNTFILKTIEVREWMKEIGAVKHYVAKDGDILINI